MRRFGLIGYPLSHSFSKKYFTEKFEQEEVLNAYDLFPLKTIDELPFYCREYPELEGLNVTIPYKNRFFFS
jgi:shikimate dehydrogenase